MPYICLITCVSDFLQFKDYDRALDMFEEMRKKGHQGQSVRHLLSAPGSLVIGSLLQRLVQDTVTSPQGEGP